MKLTTLPGICLLVLLSAFLVTSCVLEFTPPKSSAQVEVRGMQAKVGSATRDLPLTVYPGEDVKLDVRVKNLTNTKLSGVQASISSESSQVIVTGTEKTFPTIWKGEYATLTSNISWTSEADASYFRSLYSTNILSFRVAGNASAGTVIPLTVTITGSNGKKVQKSLQVTVGTR